jgi:hypothetical protein
VWAKGGAHAPTLVVGRFPEVATSTWEVVKSGTAAHMPLEERVAYSRFYDSLEALRAYIDNERAAYVRLFGYAALAALTPADAQRVLEDSAQARVLGVGRSGTALSVIQAAKAMNVNPLPFSETGRQTLAKTCALGRPLTGP